MLTGGVTKITSDPTLAFDARLEPVDLAVLQRLVPKVDSATRQARGQPARHAASPPRRRSSGELHAKADNLMIHGLPGAVTDIHIDVRATASEVAASGTGKFGGGTLAFDGVDPGPRLRRRRARLADRRAGRARATAPTA